MPTGLMAISSDGSCSAQTDAENRMMARRSRSCAWCQAGARQSARFGGNPSKIFQRARDRGSCPHRERRAPGRLSDRTRRGETLCTELRRRAATRL